MFPIQGIHKLKKLKSSEAGGTGSPSDTKTRVVFSQEFKRDAVARMRHGDQNVTELALELGLRRNQLYKWAAAFDARGPVDSFPGPGRPEGSADSALTKLKRDLDNAKQEIAILKKFNACLAQLKK